MKLLYKQGFDESILAQGEEVGTPNRPGLLNSIFEVASSLSSLTGGAERVYFPAEELAAERWLRREQIHNKEGSLSDG